MERQHLTEEQAEQALLVGSCCTTSNTWLSPAHGLTRFPVLQGMLNDFVPEQAAAFMVLLRAKVSCATQQQHHQQEQQRQECVLGEGISGGHAGNGS
jgi:hypothetical protein